MGPSNWTTRGRSSAIPTQKDGAFRRPSSMPRVVRSASPNSCTTPKLTPRSSSRLPMRRCALSTERLLSAVTPLIRDVPLQALKASDVTYVAGQTGFTARSVQALVDSAQRHLESDVIPQSDFYALFRQNLPTITRELLEVGLATIRVTLDRSSRLAVVQAMSEAELDAAVERFKQLKAQLSLRPTGTSPQSSLGDLLKTSRMSSRARDIVAGLKVEHEDTPGDFRGALRDHPDLSPSDIAAAESTWISVL